MDRKNYKKIAVAVVKNPDGKFLIVRRKVKKHSVDGSVLEWAFPGTEYVNDHENVLSAFVENETGQKIRSVREISHRKYHPFGYELKYFESELVAGNSGKVKADKISEFKWIDKSELGKYFSTNVDVGLRKYLGI